MYKITNNTLKSSVYSALAEQTREFCHRLSFGEGMGEKFSKQIDFEKGITNIEISQEGNGDSSGLVLGSCCASSCVAEFYNPDETYNYASKTMFVECGIKLDDGSFFYIPCGYYKVDKPETDDDWRTVKVTAYDCVDKMTWKWNTSLSMPSNAYLLLEEIATRYGLALDVERGVLAEMKSRTVTEAQALSLTAYTEREVCGFLAGLFGANARINTVGKLSVKRYQHSSTDDFCIPAAIQWQNGFKKTSEEEFVICSVTSGIDAAVFTAGTGAGIGFANPIITEDEIFAIYDMYAGMSFQPSSCEWRGNPCIECGDTVAVTDRNGNSYTVLVASQVIDLTGGLLMNTHCPGGDAEISFDTVDERTRAALNRQYTKFQEAIKAATDAITQTQGSIFELIPVDENDTSKGNAGWILRFQKTGISDFDDCLIKATAGGIGFSTDGGKTVDAAAMYFYQDKATGEIHGAINGEVIRAGSISADKIDTSQLKIGTGNVEGLGEELDDLLEVAENAQTTANSAKNALVNLCTDNNMTLIDGANIFTGSIAANSIDVSKLSAGTGKLINDFYNEDFSESSNSVPGWDGYNTMLSKESGYVNAQFTLQNLLPYDESEFYTRHTWTATNCVITNPHAGVDYIKVTPNNTTDWAIIATQAYLEKGKRYSISAQINPQGWSSTKSDYANTCMGYHCNGSFSLASYTSYTNLTPSTGEANVEWVFDYTGETGKFDVGLFFRGMQTSSGGVASVNIAWVAVCDADGRNKRFYSSKKDWIKSTYQSSSLINNGTHLSTAEGYITYISNQFSNSYKNLLQIFFQKKRMEHNKRYVIVSRLRVVGLSTVNSGATLAVWGQNSTGTAHTPTGLYISNKSESSAYITVKLVFDYVGETGLTDVGICWRGLINSSSSPCQIRLHWMQLYQDDTADLGFYCSHPSWLGEGYDESNLIPDSEDIDEYNKKPALNVEDNNLYFFGKVQSATGNIGFLNYTPKKVLSETSSSLYLDSSLTDLSEPDFYESSFEIAKPNGILDQVTGMANFSEIYGAHKQVRHEYASFKSIYTVQTGDEKFVSLVSGLGLNARDQSGGVLYSAKGIVIDATTELTRAELKALKKLVE